MKRHLTRILRMGALVAGSLLTVSASAEICDERIKSSAPTYRYQINADATVLDLRTNLIWQRCAVGTVLDDNGTSTVYTDDRCVADAASETEFGWQDALDFAENLNSDGGFAGAADWRVPNVKELLSLVERQCISPAINSTVFPDTTTNRSFWSSTTHTSADAYVLRFRDGTPRTEGGDRASGQNALRLLRE